jgi:hypothetical protein
MVYIQYLTETGNGGKLPTGAVATRARELDEGCEVRTIRYRVTRNTIRATKNQGARVAKKLNLAENTRGGCQGQAHITENRLARCAGNDRELAGRNRALEYTTTEIWGRISTRIHRHRVKHSGNVDVITAIEGNLLQASLEGRHSSIPCPEKKKVGMYYFYNPSIRLLSSLASLNCRSRSLAAHYNLLLANSLAIHRRRHHLKHVLLGLLPRHQELIKFI